MADCIGYRGETTRAFWGPRKKRIHGNRDWSPLRVKLLKTGRPEQITEDTVHVVH